jgi:hypothetical protein
LRCSDGRDIRTADTPLSDIDDTHELGAPCRRRSSRERQSLLPRRTKLSGVKSGDQRRDGWPTSSRVFIISA